jgi:hypothetical protein
MEELSSDSPSGLIPSLPASLAGPSTAARGDRRDPRWLPPPLLFTWLCASCPISSLLGWTGNSNQGRPPGSTVVAATVAVYLAVRLVSDQQPRRHCRRCLAASAVDKPNSGMQGVFSCFSS